MKKRYKYRQTYSPIAAWKGIPLKGVLRKYTIEEGNTMRSRLLAILLCIVMVATVFSVAGLKKVNAELGLGDVLFSDDFEDGNADDWIAFTEAGYTPGTISVDPAYARTGNYGMRRYQPTSGSTHIVNFDEQFTGSYAVEFDFKPISGRSYLFLGGIPHDRTTEPNGGIVFDRYDNTIRPYGSVVSLQTFNWGQWYHIKMEIMVDNDEYHYYIDGNYKWNIIAPFPSYPHRTFQWHMDDVDTGDDGFLDNVEITTLSKGATIDIDPNTINLGSKGNWVTCYIELPEDYDVRDINANTILLEDILPPILDTKYGFVKSDDSYIMDHDGDGILERMVKFDRSEVEVMLSPGTYKLKVTGELLVGTTFEGYSDEIRVINPP